MKITIAALATALSAGTAFAGGYVAPVVETQPVVAEPVATVAPSDWSGFYAGLQYGQGDVELSLDGDSADEDFDAYGVHGGYQRDFGRFVLGGELDYNRLDLDQGGDGDLVRLRGRAGYDLGRFLPYASLGAAHISSDNDGADLSETGLVYGLGMNFKVSERFTVGAEYTRHDFNDVDDVDGLDLEADMVQIRGSIRF
ncbi:porin family protein [Paracoccus sp. TK19116]|uniref:Porin family protein n=1 Tax=Paracoccus albicereus TaxID=2922394 RepID=A0ABT1MVH2_9RHOB|nr:porin family protein [Paracoccus albicereus]MCQ0970861.1 porin family protein [Paracoccus albicereus]